MHFRISSGLLAKFPTMCVGLVVARGVQNTQGSVTISALLRDAERDIHKRFGAHGMKQEPALAAWHKAFTEIGLSPGRFKSSVEALATRALKGGSLPELSPAVDLANATSLRYLLPIGAHDLSRVRGDITVGAAFDGALFTPMGAQLQEAVEAGEIVYADSEGVLTRRWVWRQTDRTKVTDQSSIMLFPIDGWTGATDVAVRAAQGKLVKYLESELGAKTSVAFLDHENPEALLWIEPSQPDQAIAEESGFRMSGLGYRERLNDAAGTVATDPDPIDNEAAGTISDRRPRWGRVDEVDALLHRAIVDVVVRDDLESRLRRGDRLRVKFGVDPTSPHLHLGHAVVLRKLRAFQRHGHTVCLVIGDFTAQIGDASDKTSMRQMLSEEQVYLNLTTYKKQISNILDDSMVEWTYNADWLGPLRFKDVIGLASNFTVAQMLERENFTNRFTARQPIGLQEFLYPLMQGYDSVALKADVELGGTEQLFNLLAGRTLQRAFGQVPQAVITCALLLGLDGRKMSKSYENSISLTEPAKEMYGKVMRFADDQIVSCFELCTEVPLEEIDEIAAAIDDGSNPMALKKRLAHEITRLYHSETQSRQAQEAFEREVQRKEMPEHIAELQLDRVGELPLAELLVTAGLTRSKSEARQKIREGAVYLDGERAREIQTAVTVRNGMLIKLGRHYRRVVIPA